MNWKNTNDRYGKLFISMHWAMLLLLVAVYACIELRVLYPKGTEPREALKAWHFMLGLSVFVLVWLRLTLRVSQVLPQIVPELPRWQKKLSRIMHVLLYALMIAMPISGWLILSAEGKIIPFFIIELPALIAENEAIAHTVEEIHETAGLVAYYLIGVHALAGLYHHYIQRDNTLVRMLPSKKMVKRSGEK